MNRSLIIYSFLAFLVLIVFVGLLSSRKAKATSEDYLLASRDVQPFTMAISAISSLLSGFMFIGFIGFAYVKGVSAIIYPICWVLGDFTSWFFVHKKLREKSQEENINTIPSFIGTVEKVRLEWVIKISSLITLVFLGWYAAAQLKVGSKALTTFLGWEEDAGIILAGVIVCLYCLASGIRASVWTDVIQSFFMISSMLFLLCIGVQACGGLSQVIEQLTAIDPSLVKVFPEDIKPSFFVYFLSVIVNGFGVIGQPHVMVRPMLINDSRSLSFARNVYVVWYFIFSVITVGVGIITRVLYPELIATDPEGALPLLAVKLLPDIYVGFILAGIFSATLSTADSQIISCSACITQDLFPRFKGSYLASKLSTIFIAIFAVFIAVVSDQTVFEIVRIAWSSLAASIGVLLLFKCLDKKVSNLQGSLMLIVGMSIALAWKYFSGFEDVIHETLVGVIAASAIYLLLNQILKKSNIS